MIRALRGSEIFVLALAVALLSVAAIRVSRHVCAQGATQNCVCAGGLPGAQECAGDGRRWSACDCSRAATTAPALSPEAAATASPSFISKDIEWIPIPAGSFMMGCSPGDPECSPEEKPQHLVTLKAFEILRTEVTQRQYRELTGTNPSVWQFCGDDCPVETVSWRQAKAFCEHPRVGGRLPTSAEWEYAARAGTTTEYYCGAGTACLGDVAWYTGNSNGRTHPVGLKQPNAWGLYDILGNVWEWTADYFDETYYASSPSQSPTGPATGTDRSLRGGGWLLLARHARASFRAGFAPTDRNGLFGIRCARD